DANNGLYNVRRFGSALRSLHCPSYVKPVAGRFADRGLSPESSIVRTGRGAAVGGARDGAVLAYASGLGGAATPGLILPSLTWKAPASLDGAVAPSSSRQTPVNSSNVAFAP